MHAIRFEGLKDFAQTWWKISLFQAMQGHHVPTLFSKEAISSSLSTTTAQSSWYLFFPVIILVRLDGRHVSVGHLHLVC
jgi:hypothetical protein